MTLDVDESTVYLHQIVKQPHLPNVKVIEGLKLGETKRISGAELKSLIENKYGFNINVNGAGDVVLTRRSQIISAERINNIVTQYLQNKYSNHIGKIAARIQSRDKIIAPFGDVSIHVKEIESRNLNAKMFVWIGISSLNGDSFVKKFLVKVEDFQAYPFFGEDMIKGSEIREQDIVYRVINIFSVATEIPELGVRRWRLKKNVSKNSPVMPDVIEFVPDILKGHKLNVRLKFNGIEIEYVAEAIEDACIDDYVLTIFNGKKKKVRVMKGLDGSVYGI